MNLDLRGVGWFAVVQAEDGEEGLDVFGGGKKDGLAVVVARIGYGDASLLADRVLDSDVPFFIALAEEFGKDGGGIAEHEDVVSVTEGFGGGAVFRGAKGPGSL